MHQAYAALGNKHRYQIAQTLHRRTLNVGTINKAVKISQPALSQHLKKMSIILGKRREDRHVYYYVKEPKVVRILGILAEK